MKRLIKVPFLSILFAIPIIALGQCGVIFQGNYICSENCSITGGQFLYNCIFTPTSDSTMTIYGLWGESLTLNANLVCAADSFTIPQQYVSGISYRGGGRLNGILVHVHYYANYPNNPEDECDLYYQPVVALDQVDASIIKVYPNPFAEILFLEGQGSDTAESTIELYESTGRLIRVEQVDGTKATIATNTLAPGIYFYAFKQGDTMIQSGVLKK